MLSCISRKICTLRERHSHTVTYTNNQLIDRNETRIREQQKQKELLREELNSKRLQLSSLKTKIENNFDENRSELIKRREMQ